MSKRIVLVDAFGFELFSGASIGGEEAREPREPEAEVEKVEKTEDARQGSPLESGIFFRGSPRLRKTG
jgi:hypothetical protein